MDSLSVALALRHGAFAIDVSFRTEAPWTTLFGPSGSGKSTILRVISGALLPDRGEIICGQKEGGAERILLQTSTGIAVPAWQRPFRLAGQTPRLFPSMSVRRNLRYGTQASAAEHHVAATLEEVIALFHLEKLAERMPAELSGGEQQRVSVARAVIAAAAYSGPGRARLLLDEPFSSMGAVLRDQLPLELKQWLERRSIPVLSVSHDTSEAYLLDAEVVRVENGRVLDQGSAGEVLTEERARLLHRLRS